MVYPDEKQKFLDALKELPIISVVCKRVGISKASIYRWKKEDSDFADKLAEVQTEGRDVVTDIAEGQLVAAIRRGEKWAVTYWLENNAKRYYRPKRPLAIEDTELRGIDKFIILRRNKDGTETIESTT